MGINSLTHRDDGSRVAVPVSTDDWQQWVSAGKTRNWMLDDPLIDWLQLYGKSRDYLLKQELAGYDKGLDFLEFIFDKGREFEAGILRLFQDQFVVATVAQDYREISSLDKAEETFEAMKQGLPIIYQAVLWDAHNMTYGSPDFLVRSDVLRCLFPESVSEGDAAISAPGLGANGWHYLVVDTKFTTLHLNASGTELSNEGSASAYKAQVYIYNRMLGRLQDFEPPNSYLLGRGWQRTQKGSTYRGTNALGRLGPVPQNGTVPNGVLIANAVEDALGWIRKVRTEGKDWQLLPKPSVPELYPNMSNTDCRPPYRPLLIFIQVGRVENPGLVFPAQRGKPLTDSTISKLVRENGIGCVPHGMRSSFRDWGAECSDAPREIAEFALGHVEGSAAELAYRRTDYFERRRELMQAWADYLAS